MRILVTGGGGQLANALGHEWSGGGLTRLGKEALDLSDLEGIPGVLASHSPDVIVNTGAFTQVDLCEGAPEAARRINAEAVGRLAEYCAGTGCLFVQISTDYVFSGRASRPYREDDETAPINVYGATKLMGEAAARLAPRHLIVRSGWLYDAWGRNFLQAMLQASLRGSELRVVHDQKGTPTSCRVLARQLREALVGGWEGLIHASCAGEATWYEFALEIFRMTGGRPLLRPCTTEEWGAPAPRPGYSVLDNNLRRSLGRDLMPSWEEALEEVLLNRREG